jgi:hypothetical protein
MSEYNDILKSIRFLDKDILLVEFKEDLRVERNSLKKAFVKMDEFTGGRKVKRLLVSGSYTTFSKDARSCLLEESEKRKDMLIAEALVARNLPQKMIINIYLKCLNGSFPARLFSNTKSAYEWLRMV